MALVTSDLLFCVVGLPQLLVADQSDPTKPPDSVTGARLAFYYQLYHATSSTADRCSGPNLAGGRPRPSLIVDH